MIPVTKAIDVTRKEDPALQRFNRLLAWFTLLLFAFLAISGFGMTNPGFTSRLTGGLFTPSLSMYLHANLAAPVLILLLIHFLIGIKAAVIRWGLVEDKPSNTLVNAFLIILGLFIAVLIVLARYVMLPQT